MGSGPPRKNKKATACASTFDGVKLSNTLRLLLIVATKFSDLAHNLV